MATQTINISNDNAMYREGGGFESDGGATIGKIGSTTWSGALRFDGATIEQGANINSATLYFYVGDTGGGSFADMVCRGIDEDDTDVFNNPFSRPTTTANTSVSGTIPSSGNYFSISVTSIIQEIVDRGGWSSGNALGLTIRPTGSGATGYAFDTQDATNSYLYIDYEASSPSASQSPSSSVSPSPSSSTSRSPSLSDSPSPSPRAPFTGIKIAKPDVNVLLSDNPTDMIFDSDYGTLKYFDKVNKVITLDASDDEIATKGTITHNLGYYPYVEALVRVYIGSPAGNYEYCPFAGAGATVFYDANYIIKENTIDVYGAINGVSSSIWTFDFILFIYKNNLDL